VTPSSALAGVLAPRSVLDEDRWRARLSSSSTERLRHIDSIGRHVMVASADSVQAEREGPILCLIDGTVDARRLAHQLGLDPARPAPALLAAAYPRLGEALLEELHGSYALLLWESGRRRGLLARDPSGARLLFTATAGGELRFASEVRDLLPLVDRAPSPDPMAVADWLALTASDDRRTLFAGVERLPAGRAILLEPSGSHEIRHREPRYEPVAADEASAVALVWDGLRGAVARHVEDAVQPAIRLSGGFDSSAVAAAARPLYEDRSLRAYSTTFPGDPLVDEEERISQVRSYLGLPGTVASFQVGSALAGALEFLDAWRLPPASPNLFIWLPLLRRAASQGVDVMLDGEGGDELFGTAVYLMADRLRQGRPDRALALARRIPGLGARPKARWLIRALTKYAIRGALPHDPHRLLIRLRGRPLPTWMSERAVRTHRERDDAWRWKQRSGPRWWAQLSYVLTEGADALRGTDQFRREGLLTGLELGHPLRDPALIKLVLSLPPELAFDCHVDRPLARRALRGKLPKSILRGYYKPAFDSILTSTLSAVDRPGVEALLSSAHPALTEHVKPDEVHRLLREDPQRPGWAGEVWRLASLALWLEHQFRPERLESLRGGLSTSPEMTFRDFS
jgi:asparagine synthetase B (glutamine-hydrolysing)